MPNPITPAYLAAHPVPGPVTLSGGRTMTFDPLDTEGPIGCGAYSLVLANAGCLSYTTADARAIVAYVDACEAWLAEATQPRLPEAIVVGGGGMRAARCEAREVVFNGEFRSTEWIRARARFTKADWPIVDAFLDAVDAYWEAKNGK